MANKPNAFETSDVVSMKGEVRGITKISRKAKMLLMFGLGCALALIVFALLTMGDDDVQKKDVDPLAVKTTTPSSPQDLFKGVGNGSQPAFDIEIEKKKEDEKEKVNLDQSTSPPPPAKTAEELAKENADSLRRQSFEKAITATVESAQSGSSGGMASPLPLAQMPASGATGNAPMLGLQTPETDDENKQIRKEKFLKEASSQTGNFVLGQTRIQSISKYELKMGWKIPAFLIDGINSDLPGSVCALVRENVYDTATGKYLLIPQGTKACGRYDSRVSMGQQRIHLAWDRLIFPDASTLDLQGMGSSDQSGASGFDADVDNHYTRVFGGAILMSIITAGAQLSQPPQSLAGSSAAPTVAQTGAGALGQNLGQIGAAIAQRDLKIQPTLKQQPGYRFLIDVSKDIVFASPYVSKR